MPQGFLTDQNVVAIIPEGRARLYFIRELIDGTDEQRARFRTVHNLRGPDGLGGLSTVEMYTMAASCPNKLAAWGRCSSSSPATRTSRSTTSRAATW
ncbi:MAG: hypothetical protein R3C32_00515 [Chloroflexota bacterium]